MPPITEWHFVIFLVEGYQALKIFSVPGLVFFMDWIKRHVLDVRIFYFLIRSGNFLTLGVSELPDLIAFLNIIKISPIASFCNLRSLNWS